VNERSRLAEGTSQRLRAHVQVAIAVKVHDHDHDHDTSTCSSASFALSLAGECAYNPRVMGRALQVSLLFFAGCGGASAAARMTAGAVPCEPEEIWITDETSDGEERAWTASCQQRRFRCTLTYERPAEGFYDLEQRVVCREAAEGRSGPARSIRQFEEGRGPELEGFVEIDDMRLVLRAAPIATPNTITLSIELPRRLEERDCQVAFLAGDVPVSFRSIYSPVEHGGAWRLQIPYDDLERMGSASALIGRLCGTEEFTFSPEQRAVLVELVERARRASVIEVDE
jgi:hypothetical protein